MRISDWSSDVCSSDLSEQYFSKEPEELTLGEAAMLAGLVKAPSRLAPTHNYAAARTRGRLVIAAMKAQGLITDRSEERREGNGCVSTCRSRWLATHYKKKSKTKIADKHIKTNI